MTTTALAGALLLAAPEAIAADLDLLGVNTSLPAAPFATPMLSGADNVVNTSGVAATLTEGGAGASVYSGQINQTAGMISLTHTGGTLTITGSNNFSGNTTITGGTIQAQANSALGSGQVVVNNGAVLQSGAVVTLLNNLDLQGTGFFSLNGFNTRINSLSSPSSTSRVSLGANELSLTNAAGNFGGGMSGAGSLRLMAGALTLSGANLNSYAGATSIDGGTLKGGATNAFNAGSATALATGSALDLGGFNQTVNVLTGTGQVTNSGAAAGTLTIGSAANTSFAGAIQNGVGTLGLTKAGTGTYTLSGALSYTGATTVNAGTLTAAAANGFSAASATTVNAGGTLDLGGVSQAINSVNLAGGTIQNGNLTATGGISSNGGAISAKIVGASTLTAVSGVTTLSGANTSTGLTTVNNGATLTLSNSGFLAGGLTNAGTANIAGSLSGAVTNTGTLIATGSTINGAIANSGSGVFNVNSAVAAASTFTNAAGATLNTNGNFTLTGLLSNSGVLNVNNNTLDVSAAGLSNTGTLALGTLATLSGTVVNSGTLTTAGLLSGAVTNSGTVNAGLGTLSGAIQNSSGGIFNATGIVATGSTFTNDSNATLNSSGVFTLGAALTNAGVINVTAGTLDATAGGLTNSGSINVSQGAFLRDALANSGTVTNNGTYVAAIASNTGTITNNGVWNGDVQSNAGVIVNTGTWNAASLNNSGTFLSTGSLSVTGAVTNSGTFTSSGTLSITGAISNTGTLNLTGNVNAGSYTNTGTLSIEGARTITATTFTNASTGVISMQQGAAPVTGDRLTIRGTYNGASNSALAVDINLNASGAGSTRTDQLQITGATSGTTTVRLRNIGSGAVSLLTSPITIVDGMPGASFIVSTDATTQATLLPKGLLSYNFQEVTSGSGKWGIVPAVQASSAAQAANQTSSLMTMLNTSFFQNPSSLISAAEKSDPNKVSGGPWIRFANGNFGARTQSTPGPLAMTSSNVRSNFAGYQVGADIGLSNIGNSNWNLRVGVTAGQINAADSDKTAASVAGNSRSSNSEVPFYGFYTAVSHKGFFADAMWRQDKISMTLDNTTHNQALLTKQKLQTPSTTMSASTGYRFETEDKFFVEPTVSVSYTNSRLSDTVLNGGYGTIATGSVENLLANVRARFGYDFQYGQWALQAFGSAGVWREFASNITSTFTYNGSQLPVYSTRLGMFGQFSAGLNGKLLNTGFTGFGRVDLATGYSVQSTAFTGGVRYQF